MIFSKKGVVHIEKYVAKAIPSSYQGISLNVEAPEVKLFPPSILIPSVSGQIEGEKAFSLNRCKVGEVVKSFLEGGRNVNVKCEEGFLTGKMFETVKVEKITEKIRSLKESEKRVERPPQKEMSFNVSIDDIRFFTQSGSQSFNAALDLENNKGIFRFRSNDDRYFKNSGEILFEAGSKKGEIRLDDISVDMIAPFIPDIPFNIKGGSFDGRVETELKSGNVTVDTDIAFKDIVLENLLIDSVPFDIPFLRLNGRFLYDFEKEELSLNELKAGVGGIDGVLDGSFSKNSKKVRFSSGETSLVRLSTIIDDELFSQFNVGGTIDVEIDIELSEGELPKIAVVGRLDEPVQHSDRMDYLKTEFIYREKINKKRDIFIGPTNGYFVSIEELPEYFIWAVVTAEDAGFFNHKGIDFAEISAAARDNVTRRRMRGGSTITQQLVKNLFLSREQTFMRKFKEMLLAIELDATLPKERILEIYFNIIKWAPDVFGIGEASLYYFGKPPMELSVLESAYLASIIPGPYLYHRHFLEGSIDQRWINNLHRLLDRLHETEKITLDQYFEAIKGKIVFREIEREVSEEE